MKAALDGLEARKAELTELLATAPQDMPDLLPSISAVYARKVEQLAAALNCPEDRQAAAQALRGLIEKIVLTPGVRRGEMEATLYGKLGTILNWTDRQPSNKNTPGAGLAGVF
ncbi:hypothetical protein [Pseudaminobacter soli (ex Li et al. 2025)]|uniref:Uncharacterized protein n=1 Tax=Pseudaminobacter soli (ex Li et al. 2025) TaxID=1295366 RepID=A0A2P7S3S7_9HYPH|nr:hypothetical protein [Mesorhizobium soli]PSJ57126.1 hypothetical protein C7I85_23165 [Mesorhizobium soli]